MIVKFFVSIVSVLIVSIASEFCPFHYVVNLDFELLEVVLETAKSAASIMIRMKLTRAEFTEAGWIGFGSV